MTATAANTKGRPARAKARSPLAAVAMPAEHGGWGLTFEPGILGLLVAPSAAGLCITLGAMVAFLARTPLKIVAVDRRRDRWLARTTLAARVAIVEIVALVALVAGAVRWGEPWFWWPAVAALPLLVIEASYEVRSRGRNLVPEVAGAVGVSSVATMVALAGGAELSLAVGLWVILGGRAVTSVPYVRQQIARLRGKGGQALLATAGDVAALALAAVAVALDGALVAGTVALAGVVVVQRLWGRAAQVRPLVIGMRQLGVGVTVVLVTGFGVLAAAS